MLGDRKPDLALVIADPRRIAELHVDEIPGLLGALERVRAALWARMVRAPAPVTREPGTDTRDELVTVPEVAKELRFTRAYMYEAVRRGDLSAVRKGKYVRIRRSDLRAWLDGRPAKGLDPRPRPPDSARHAPTRPGPASPSPGISRVSRRRHVPVAASVVPLGHADS